MEAMILAQVKASSFFPPVFPVFAVHDVRHLSGHLLRHQPLQLLHLAVRRHGHRRPAVAACHQARPQTAHQG